jgi:GPH family glycoside/pentoside/hexuronide:cation symporter
VPNASQQPAMAMLGIRIVIGPVPAVLLVCGIVFALLYPLSRERFNQVRQELEARRQAQLKGEP